MKNAISFASDIDTFLDPPALRDSIDFIHTRVLLIFLPRLGSCLKMAIFFLYKKSKEYSGHYPTWVGLAVQAFNCVRSFAFFCTVNPPKKRGFISK